MRRLLFRGSTSGNVVTVMTDQGKCKWTARLGEIRCIFGPEVLAACRRHPGKTLTVEITAKAIEPEKED